MYWLHGDFPAGMMLYIQFFVKVLAIIKYSTKMWQLGGTMVNNILWN